MQYELIGEDDFEGLIEEPIARFLRIETILRQNLQRLIAGEQSHHEYDALLRVQYMAQVSAAAEALGIDGIEFPDNRSQPDEHLQQFLIDVSMVTMKLRLTSQPGSLEHSVRLAERTRKTIRAHIESLRQAVRKSDLDQDVQKRLFAKLDDLDAALDKPRLPYGKAMAVISFVTFNIAAATSFLADAPDALQTLTTITRLIGQDQVAEQTERERIGAPPTRLRIEGPKTVEKAETSSGGYGRGGGYGGRGGDLDDEIPF